MHNLLTRLLAKGPILGIIGKNRKLDRFSNMYAGRRAVVIGNGPSLTIDDLERLGDSVTFASNKIYLIFDQVKWRPTVYTVCDALLAEDNKAAILSADFSKSLVLHHSVVRPHLKDQRGACFYKYGGNIAHWAPGQPAVLRKNISDGIFEGGYSVVIEQIQLAYAMGCSEVVLIGVDFFYGGTMVSTGEQNASGEVVKADGNKNHFHPNYYRPGDRHTVPKLTEQVHAHTFCREAFISAGLRIVNASRKTGLNVLERVNFDDLF